MIKNILLFILLLSFIFTNNIAKIDKNNYNQLFKQARSLEKNGLFDQAKLIYKEILLKDPGNKIAFNKIKVILKNENNLILLKDLAEKYYLNQINNPMAKVDLLDAYLISDDNRWKIISDEIFEKNIKTDFLIKALFTKLLEYELINYVTDLIQIKRNTKNKDDFYSLELGNYYFSRLNYEKAVLQFLLYLSKNKNKYDMISNKILTIPGYEDVQEKIQIILDESLLVSSKILLSDLAFKNGNFSQSYDLLKNNFEYPKQLLDFAYQNKKIDNYDLAIEVYQYIINQNYNSRITISAILEMADTFELKSIESKFQLPISQYFYNNQILVSPYYYVDTKNLKVLNEAISLYDSLYTISKGSDAGFKLAGIKFAILKDLDGALDIYSDCVKYSNNQSIIFNSKLKIIDIWIAKGNLLEAITWSERIQTELNQNKKIEKSNYDMLKIKNIQIDFFNNEESLSDSISNLFSTISKDNKLYNDLLDMQSVLLSFKDNQNLFNKFSNISFLIYQDKQLEAINLLMEIYNSSSNIIINDFIISQLSYLLLLNNRIDDSLNYLDLISHETIFSEFSYILKAEIFDFVLKNKKNAVDIYFDFLEKYPLSIFHEDIRLRLRTIGSNS